MASLFRESSINGMFDNLIRMGEQYGIEMKPYNYLSNSWLALAAGEFAKDQGKFRTFHEAVFRAYFSEGKDIGNLEIILDLAQASGMKQEELKKVLDDNRYSARLSAIKQEAHSLGITGAPTFIINERYKIVGAQPFEKFRNTFAKIATI